MTGREIAYAVLPFVVLIAMGLGSWMVLRRRDGVSGPRGRARPGRPWWGNPWLWIGVAAAMVVLGIFVWPGLFGGVIVVLPLVWFSRPRTPEMDPRSNGHQRRDDAMGG